MKLSVKTSSTNYDVIIENDIFLNIGAYLKDIVGKNKLFIVTDSNVDAIYGEKLKSMICGMDYGYIVLKSGEHTKCLKSLEMLYKVFAKAEMTRSDYVFAFGGGVIGDLTGFAAATYLRGIKYIGMPTTLLSQVDSSVGGKVAVNLDEGKNLVGNFYPPYKVFIDPNMLKTLPKRVFNDGMAEVIKYGAIRDEKLFDRLFGDIGSIMDDIIFTCVDIKRKIVENDEFDTGERMVLNFGHTFGHVVENIYNYDKYTHGEAVAIGMAVITEKSEKMGVTSKGTYDKLVNILKKYDLYFGNVKIDRQRAKEILYLDKKSSKDYINYVFIEAIGNAVIKQIDKKDTFLLD